MVEFTDDLSSAHFKRVSKHGQIKNKILGNPDKNINYLASTEENMKQ